MKHTPTYSKDEKTFREWFSNVKNLPAIFRLCFKIRNKKGDLVPLILNKAQKIVLKQFIRAYQEGRPLRFIIVKARQKGISTLWEAVIYWLSIVNKYFKATIVGHESDASDNLFNMTKRYHDNIGALKLDDGRVMNLKPEERHNNRKELNFKELDSVIEIQTAEGGERVKRSDTIQAAHLTEVAFWRDAKNTLLALLQTIPDQPNTLCVLESTANGIGGPFYNRWQVANGEKGLGSDTEEDESELAGATDYIPIFISWLIDDEYTRPFRDEREKQALLDDLGNPKYNAYKDEERILMKERGATLEHLNWRRFTIKDKCDGDVEMFHQEYPSTPEEAFVTSGRPVFDVRVCNHNLITATELERDGKQPLQRGELVVEYETNNLEYKKLRDEGIDTYLDLKRYIKSVRLEESPKGSVKIFGDVSHKDGEHYKFAAGSDVAEGLEQGDYDAIKVLNRKDMEIVLTYHGHTDPDLLANEQHKIWLFLNKDCYFATERNNHGLTTINTAFKLGVYQYYAQDFEKGYPKDTEFIGFKTTSGSRTPAINDLKEAIREGDFKDYEKEFWMECLTFVKNSKGKMQAQDKDKDPATKCFDDRVFAALIMWRCHLWMPNYNYIPPVYLPSWVNKAKKKRVQRSSMSH